MKRIFTLFFSLLLFVSNASDLVVDNPYRASFKKAYSLFPSVPKGFLESVAFTQTRFAHLDENAAPSCIGYPQAFSVMGLIENGKGYFRNSLSKVAQLSGFREADIKSNPETAIIAYAAAFHALQQQKNIFSDKAAEYLPVLIELSELPLNNNLQDNFALNSHLYQIFWLLNNSEFQEGYEIPYRLINLQEIFGSNYEVLSAKSVVISPESITNTNGSSYKLSSSSVFSQDYPPALWTAAASCNYSSRNGTAISAVTIHFVQGSYAGCISWFQNCSASASAHYVVRSSDGQVTQMVLESAKAWHVGTENPYSVGIEHEGYINNSSWFTNAMYNSSGALSRDICIDNNINRLRTYYGPSCSGSSSQCLLGSCTKVKGHQHNPNQTHTDPGPYWNWARYYKLINNTYTLTAIYTATSGAFYDTGGSAGNYGNDERKFWLFTKAGATNITLSFSTFNAESGYDNLFIYNGGSPNSPLIGQYTGTVNPGPVTSVNDSLLVEFRSDCATTASGWVANYTINGTVTPGPQDVVAPTTIVNAANAWQTATFTATVADNDNAGGSGVEKGYYQAIDFNGTEWRANYTRGFFADNFDNAIHPEWTQKTGTWTVAGNALVQTDEVSTAAGNTNIYAALTQSLSNRYLYHYLAKFEGSGTSRRGGFHFFCDQPDSSNRNNSYFVWFRLDDQKIQIYKVENNVFGAPKVDLPLSFVAGQWYDIKVIYDRITGKIKVYFNNAPVASWTDTSPFANGNYISFRSGNCKMSIDELKIYRSRAASVNVLVGAGMTNDLRFQNPSPVQPAGKIKSICQDSAGNLSSIFYYDLNIDWTPPTQIATVNDGPANDIAIVNTTDSLRANWTPSSDPNSGIVKYHYSIGTAPGATNVLSWTSNWAATSVTVYSLNLVQNTTYYFNIRPENGAGMMGPITSSNGQKVDTTTIVTGISSVLQTEGVEIFPNPFSERLSIKVYSSGNCEVLVSVADVLGREVYSEKWHKTSGIAEKTMGSELKLAKGTYMVTVKYGDQKIIKKLIKE